METETNEDSSKFRRCVLASTQQNAEKNSTKQEGPEYSSDIDFI